MEEGRGVRGRGGEGIFISGLEIHVARLLPPLLLYQELAL